MSETFEEECMADVKSLTRPQELCTKAIEILFAFVHAEEVELPLRVAMAIGVISARAYSATEAEVENERLRGMVNKLMSRAASKDVDGLG